MNSAWIIAIYILASVGAYTVACITVLVCAVLVESRKKKRVKEVPTQKAYRIDAKCNPIGRLHQISGTAAWHYEQLEALAEECVEIICPDDDAESDRADIAREIVEHQAQVRDVLDRCLKD